MYDSDKMTYLRNVKTLKEAMYTRRVSIRAATLQLGGDIKLSAIAL